MPKLKNRLPKLCKMGKYAVVNYQKKKKVLGKWGTPEAKRAYALFITEIQNNPAGVPHPYMGTYLSTDRKGLVSELSARYLDYVKASGIDKSH